MKTYRYAGHSRSDQALYRPSGELEAWKARDPIDLLQAKLVQQAAATKDQLETMRSEISAEIAAVAERVLATPKAGPSDMFRHIYAVPNRVGGGVP
jgi:acetoin:2,6-dichlorophenolindophenol oxidoreductase subunit alpha